MLHLLHTHWLWFFGACALGIIVGWLAFLRDAPRWTDRAVRIAIGVVAVGAVVALARVVPGRYGHWLELGVIFAVFYAVGCFIGWALRDLAEYMPTTGAATAGGSYLFRDAHAGIGTGSAYMRTSALDGTAPRERLPLVSGALTRAPVPGGYTFPAMLPFADATTRRAAASAPGTQRHWSWPRPAHSADAAAVPAFTGSQGGYIFPAAAAAASRPIAPGAATTRAGHYRHWSWRGTEAAGSPATPTAALVAAPVAAREASAAGLAAARPAGAPTTGGYVFPVAPPSAAPATSRGGSTRSGLYRHWSWRGIDAAAPAGSVATPPESPAAAVGSQRPEGASPSAAPLAAEPVAATPVAPPSPGPTAAPPAGDTAPSAPRMIASSDTPSTTGGGAPDAGSPSQATPAAPVAPRVDAAAGGTLAAGAAGGAMSAPSQATAAAPAVGGSMPPTAASSATSDAPRAAAVTQDAVGARTISASPAPPGAAGDADAPWPVGETLDATPPAMATPAAPPAPTSVAPAPAVATPSPDVDAPLSSGVAAGGTPNGGAIQDPSIASSGAPAAASAATPETPAVVDPVAAGLPAAPPAAPGEPATIASVPDEEKHAGARPVGLMTARDNRADDLKHIRGIGPQNEGRLHGLGIWHFDQIAAWTPENVRWVGSYLAFPGRIDRERWLEQAAVLASGGDTALSQRVRAGRVTTSQDAGSRGQLDVDPGVASRPRKPQR